MTKYTRIHTHTHTHIYIYIYIYLCACVCLCLCCVILELRWRLAGKPVTNHYDSLLVRRWARRCRAGVFHRGGTRQTGSGFSAAVPGVSDVAFRSNVVDCLKPVLRSTLSLQGEAVGEAEAKSSETVCHTIEFYYHSTLIRPDTLSTNRGRESNNEKKIRRDLLVVHSIGGERLAMCRVSDVNTPPWYGRMLYDVVPLILGLRLYNASFGERPEKVKNLAFETM